MVASVPSINLVFLHSEIFLARKSCLCSFKRESWKFLEWVCKRQPSLKQVNYCFCSSGYTTNLENCAWLPLLEICSHEYCLLAPVLWPNFHCTWQPFLINNKVQIVSVAWFLIDKSFYFIFLPLLFLIGFRKQTGSVFAPAAITIYHKLSVL